jgi:hypothetical protein
MGNSEDGMGIAKAGIEPAPLAHRMTNLFDHYSFRARLQPALIVLLPISLAVVACLGPEQPWMSAIWTLCATGGATYLLAVFVRNRGKENEPALWKSWGGCPTTQLLRHAGPANPVMRERWHTQLEKFLGKPLPTMAEETADPQKADHAYEAASKFLIGKTRDTKNFPLLYKENVTYGFCRNLHAMRTAGIFISLCGAIVSAHAAVLSVYLGKIDFVPIAACFISVLLLWGWVFRIRPKWVRIPAFAYAERLFESIDLIKP